MAPHDYKKFAKQYSQLGIRDTFYLGYRDLPLLIKKYVRGKKALDFGCGTGRSTRFLRELGLEAVGVDISADMLGEAKLADPGGKYELILNDGIPCQTASFDLALLFAVLMEIPTKGNMTKIFSELNRALKKDGIAIIVTDAENMYKHDCASFVYSYPENKSIKSGMQVKIGLRGTDIIFHDYCWTEQDYREIFSDAGFKILELLKPLATGKEPFGWYSEKEYPHFAVYVLGKNLQMPGK